MALGKLNLPVAIDGIFGEESLRAANHCDVAALLNELRALQALRYGWMRRAAA